MKALSTIPNGSKASASSSSVKSGGRFATKTLPRKYCNLIADAPLDPLFRPANAGRNMNGAKAAGDC